MGLKSDARFWNAGRGQTLAGAVVVLLALTLVVPFLVFSGAREAQSTASVQNSDVAFNLADAAVNRGFFELDGNSADWSALSSGTALAGYSLDQAYADLRGGSYAVGLSSSSDPAVVLVTGVGRDRLKGQVREIQALYSRNALAGTAIRAGTGCAFTGNNFQVELGAVYSPQAIAINGRLHPQFWSSSSIDADLNGPTPPNCDGPSCCQWHSYSDSVPPAPNIDLDFYKSSAQAAGTYFSTPQTWKNFAPAAGTYYLEGDLTVQSPGIFVQGNLIVMGNVYLPNGAWGKGTVNFSVPGDAWKQYCADWSYYRSTFDPAAPASFPGLSGGYRSDPALTCTTGGKTMVDGFFYVNGGVNAAGGSGSGDIVGVLITQGAISVGSNSQGRVYFQPTVAQGVKTTSFSLARTSWREVQARWPSGLP